MYALLLGDSLRVYYMGMVTLLSLIIILQHMKFNTHILSVTSFSRTVLNIATYHNLGTLHSLYLHSFMVVGIWTLLFGSILGPAHTYGGEDTEHAESERLWARSRTFESPSERRAAAPWPPRASPQRSGGGGDRTGRAQALVVAPLRRVPVSLIYLCLDIFKFMTEFRV